MRTKLLATAVCLLVICGAVFLAARGVAAPNAVTFQTFEYATIQWGGREFTHLIRPTGQVEMLAPLFKDVQRQERVNERALQLTIAMNALAKEGYELAGVADDKVVMRRALAK